jgi:hypothetical protein
LESDQEHFQRSRFQDRERGGFSGVEKSGQLSTTIFVISSGEGIFSIQRSQGTTRLEVDRGKAALLELKSRIARSKLI